MVIATIPYRARLRHREPAGMFEDSVLPTACLEGQGDGLVQETKALPRSTSFLCITRTLSFSKLKLPFSVNTNYPLLAAGLWEGLMALPLLSATPGRIGWDSDLPSPGTHSSEARKKMLCVSVCMCVCTCVNVYMYVSVCMCLCMYCECVCTCIQACMCLAMYVCMWVGLCAYVCLCMCLCMYACVYVFVMFA